MKAGRPLAHMRKWWRADSILVSRSWRCPFLITRLFLAALNQCRNWTTNLGIAAGMGGSRNQWEFPHYPWEGNWLILSFRINSDARPLRTMQTSDVDDGSAFSTVVTPRPPQPAAELLPPAVLMRNTYNEVDAILFCPLPREEGQPEVVAVEPPPAPTTLFQSTAFLPSTSAGRFGSYRPLSYWR